MRSCLCATLLLLLCSQSANAQQAAFSQGPTIWLDGKSFVALRVADVDEAARWYQRVFGLDELNRLEDTDGRYDIWLLGGPSLLIELIEQPDVSEPPDPHLGIFKTGIRVRDAEGFRTALAEAGVDVDDRTFVDEALGMRTFVFRDLAGNRLQAFEPCSVTGCG